MSAGLTSWRGRLGGVLPGILLGLVFGPSLWLPAAGPAEAQPPPGQEWHLVEAGDLAFVSQVPPAEVERIAAALGALRRVVGETTTLVPRGPVPVRFYVFRDEGSQRPYHHTVGGEPALLSGAYYPARHADLVTLSARHFDQSVVTAGHEYLHTVLHTQLPGAPLWLEEGLAELYGHLRYAEAPSITGTVAVLGLPVTEYQRTLDHLGWTLDSPEEGGGRRDERGRYGRDGFDLAGLLLLDSDSPDYHDFDAQRSFYARSWLLVHRLVLGPVRRRLESWDFVAARSRRATLSRAYHESFGVDPAAFVDELRAHSASLPYRKFDVTGSAPTVSSRRLGRGELLVHLGELLAAAGRSEDAALHFRLAFEAAAEGDDPGTAVASRAVAGLGYVHETDRDWSRARAQYARAVNLTPDDPVAAFRYGASLLVLGRATSAARLAEARHLLRKATMLEPELAPAWAALLDAHGFSGEAGEVETVYARLRAARPGVALALLLHYARHGRRGEATELIRRVLDTEDAELRRIAHGVMDRLDWVERGRPLERDLVTLRPLPAQND